MASFRDLSLTTEPPRLGAVGVPTELTAGCAWRMVRSAEPGARWWVVEANPAANATLARRLIDAAIRADNATEVYSTRAGAGAGSSFVVSSPAPLRAVIELPAALVTVVPVPAAVSPPNHAPALAVARRLGLLGSNGTATAARRNPIIESTIAQIAVDRLYKNIDELSEFHTRLSTSGPDVAKAEAYLTGRFVELGYDVATFNFRDDMAGNVIATLPGTKFPEQVVIAGAHYDSRSTRITDPTQRAPGADDNGSGSAHILELARVFAENRLSFEYTVQLVLFCGEEQGLVGSRAYATHLADTGVSVLAMFNADMLAYRLPNTERTVGMKDRYVADWLLAVANDLARQYVPDLLVGSSASCCSDHQSFTENGFPAIGYFENEGSASDYPHYHQSSDLLDLDVLDLELAKLISQACAATLMTFAVPTEER